MTVDIKITLVNGDVLEYYDIIPDHFDINTHVMMITMNKEESRTRTIPITSILYFDVEEMQ